MSDRPSQRRRRGYGRGVQRSVSTPLLSIDTSKRKKFAFQERQQNSTFDNIDEDVHSGSLESNEYSGSSSLSSIDLVKSRSGSRDFHRRAFVDLDKSSRARRRSSLFQDSVYYLEPENIHPNVIYDEVDRIDLPPSKNKKLRHAPNQRQKSYESEALLALSPPNLRKRKMIRSKSLTLDIYRSPEPLTRSRSLKYQSGRNSPAFSNASSVSSFSSIAKTGISGWQKKCLKKASENFANKENSNNVEAQYSDYDTVDTATTPYANNEPVHDVFSPDSFSSKIDFHKSVLSPSTPERSIKSERRDSSRKRGVCDSPSLSLEEINVSISSTHRLTRVRDTSISRSSRSRSRMFQRNSRLELSTNFSSIFQSRETGHKKSTNAYQMRSSSSIDSDNEEASRLEEKSDDDMKPLSASSSGELSFTITNEHKNEFQESTIGKSPDDINGSHFNATISQLISPKGQQQMKRVNIDPNDIPSSRDLEYLVHYLRKTKSSQGIASFGTGKAWTVVASSTWSASRKATFLTWATTGLGFCLRPAGCGISFLLTTRERGLEILEHLEKILGRLNNSSSNEIGAVKPHVRSDIPTVSKTRPNGKGRKKRNEKIPTFFPITTSKLTRSMRKNQAAMDKVKVSPSDRNIEVELLNSLEKLDLNVGDTEGESIETSPLQLGSEEASSSLARMVTLENDENTNSKVLSISPKEKTFAIDKKVRHSGEFVAGSQDLLMHCHGISPQSNNDRPRPSRLNISNAFTPRYQPDILSPCTIDTQKSYSAAKHIYENIDSGYNNEKIETPMPTGCTNSWGSRPIPGRDWGLSNPCATVSLSILMQRFEARSSEYNSLQSSQVCFHTNNTELYVDPNIKEIVASTADLGFDQEVIHIECDNNNLKEKCEKQSEDIWDEHHQSIPEENNAGDSLNVASADIQLMQREIHNRVFIEGVDDIERSSPRNMKRRMKSLAKHKRVSLCTSLLDTSHGANLFEKVDFFSSDHYLQSTSSFQHTSISSSFNCNQICSPFFPKMIIDSPPCKIIRKPKLRAHGCVMNHAVLCKLFSFLDEASLFCQVSLVCSKWSNAATSTLSSLAVSSLGLEKSITNNIECKFDEFLELPCVENSKAIQRSLSWLLKKFPKGSYLSEGAFKEVFRVWNSDAGGEEALSMMDIGLIESMGNKPIIGAELSISILLSSLARRNICPNFVIIRGLFTCPHKPPLPKWTSMLNNPHDYAEDMQSGSSGKDFQSMYQFIRMELCKFGDVEGFINKQPGKIIQPTEARILLFQMAFALHTAGDRFGLKHYDVKLLNFFLQSANRDDVDEAFNQCTTLRYGFGAHIFSLRLPTSRAFIAKLADYGTSKLQSESDGQPVSLGQFTTIENTPPEFMILGDNAKQGYGHDYFGLGLCMLHLFTGHGPYEEILEEVRCPPLLKKRLQKIWESSDSIGYDVIKSVILADAYEDENGDIEGTPDEVMYDTLYRYLVLFGIPKNKQQGKTRGKVWRVITSSLISKRVGSSNSLQYQRDCKKFSILEGNDSRIRIARKNLENMEGGMKLLLGLTAFDSEKRWTALDVINSTFMEPLRECSQDNLDYRNDIVHSFMTYKTHTMISS